MDYTIWIDILEVNYRLKACNLIIKFLQIEIIILNFVSILYESFSIIFY